MSSAAIQVEGLGKSYRIGLREEANRTLREAIWAMLRSPLERLRRLREHEADGQDVFWALRDVSFQVRPGEVVGIVGRNGAGKSTLLKILSRIVEPTEGRAVIRGRVGSLLEVGTGFHQELTGRENIYLNGAILGMKKAEIDRKFDEIVDFSGVEKFLDTPVKRYSSGMRVRLGFAVAAHLDPEILIVDEVLAVGDAEFQRKCLGKMNDVAHNQGRTVLFVSHNMASLQNLCDRGIVLEGGRGIFEGTIGEAIDQYLRSFSKADESDTNALSVRRGPGHTAVISRLEFLDKGGNKVRAVQTCAPVTVRIYYRHSQSLRKPSFGLIVENTRGVAIFRVQTRFQVGLIPDLPEEGVVECKLPRLNLVPGVYYFSVSCASDGRQIDFLERHYELQVVEADVYQTGRMPKMNTLILMESEWKVPAPTGANGPAPQTLNINE